MRDILFLARRYMAYHKGKTAILMVCLSTALALPLTSHWLVRLLQSEMLERSVATPMVIGAQGSRFDLVLHALYFHTEAPGVIPQEERFSIANTQYAETIPVFSRYRTQGHPIVGTTLEYFAFRNLQVAEGNPLTMLGDCVVGWKVAQRLGISPGDRLLSDPENLFVLAGSYPLSMRVAGILERSNSPDDLAVFVDLRTAWVIQGIGHGHEDLAGEAEPQAILERAEHHVTASPALQTYTRITPENIHSFHFHGDPSYFPLTAIIAVPKDERAGTLLMGRYASDDSRYQILRPSRVVDELLGIVVRLRSFFDIQHTIVITITILLISLVFALSLRLRRREVTTLVHIGCRRSVILGILSAELVILLAVSTILAFGASWLVLETARTWIQSLIG